MECPKCHVNINLEVKETVRRYIYRETEEEILNWARKIDLRAPNSKKIEHNLPFAIEQYINHLKWKGDKN